MAYRDRTGQRFNDREIACMAYWYRRPAERDRLIGPCVGLPVHAADVAKLMWAWRAYRNVPRNESQDKQDQRYRVSH